MKILIAIDGSDCSKYALKQAQSMECPKGTELMVISAVDFLEPLPSLEGVKRQEIQATERLVHHAVDELRAAQPNATVTGAVLDGYALEEILGMCKNWQPDLLMVGSHGRGGLDYLLMGSVSRTLFLEAACAVRIVRSRSIEHEKSGAYNVILALDESQHTEQIVDHVLATPWSSKTNFKCIHVVRKTPQSTLCDPDSAFTETLKSHYDNLVAGRKGWLDAAVYKMNDKLRRPAATAEILRGEPRKVILDLARDWPADLVIVGSHGRRGIDKVILGSVSEAVAMHAQCSVEMTRVKSPARQKVHIIV